MTTMTGSRPEPPDDGTTPARHVLHSGRSVAGRLCSEPARTEPSDGGPATRVLARGALAFFEEGRRQLLFEQVRAFAEDERTRAIAKRVGAVVLSAVVAEHQKRHGDGSAAVLAAVVGELRRLPDGAGRPAETSPGTARRESDAVPAPDPPRVQAPPGAGDLADQAHAWTAPAWSDVPPRPSEQTPYPSQPITCRLGGSDLGKLQAHPELPELWVEVLTSGFQEYALAVEWRGRFPRSLYAAAEVPTSWTLLQHQDFFLPMEVRRAGSAELWCRWLEPGAADREFDRASPPSPPMDPQRAEARVRMAMNYLSTPPRPWHV